MEDDLKYKGKPTVYLDQNILDLFAKYGLGEFGKILVDNYQIVYSNETLEEIKRSKGYEDKFLEVLTELKAYHLKLVIELPSFTNTNRAELINKNPFEVYEEYCQAISEELDINHIMQQFLFKMYGGRQGDSFADIFSEESLVFEKLMDSILDTSKELPEIMQSKILSEAEVMKEQYKVTSSDLEMIMKKDVPNAKSWNGIKDFRSHMNIGPKNLNNIRPPNVLLKIWEVFKDIPPYNELDLDIEDFFSMKKNPIYPERPYYIYQRVAGIYNMLNTLGYFPDSNVNKERRFVAAMSDNTHASIASFSDILLSNDESFIKKTAAAYEFLGVTTQACYVSISYE